MDLKKAYELLSVLKAPNTAKSYLTSFNRVARDVFKMTIEELLNDPDKITKYNKIIKYIWSDKIPMGSKKTVLTGFYMVSKLVVRTKDLVRYKKELMSVRKAVEGHLITEGSKKQEKTKEKFTWDDLIEKHTFYKQRLTKEYNPKIDISYLLLSLYYMLPPLRPQDYVNTRIFTDSSKKSDNEICELNYIDLKTGKLIINYHKTFRDHNKKIIKIPHKLLEIIKNFKKKSKSPWIVPTLRQVKKPMTRTQFTHFFCRIFDPSEKIKITPGFLRNYYVSMRLDDKKVTDKERAQDAKIMGHNPQMADLVYSKLSKKTKHRRSSIKKYSGSKTSKKK